MNYLKISNFALQDNGNSIEIPSTDPLFKHLKLVKYVDQSKIAGNTVLFEDTEKQFDDDDFEVASCGPSNMVAGVLVSSVADLVRDSIKDTAVSSEAGASKVWNPVSLPTQQLKNCRNQPRRFSCCRYHQTRHYQRDSRSIFIILCCR